MWGVCVCVCVFGEGGQGVQLGPLNKLTRSCDYQNLKVGSCQSWEDQKKSQCCIVPEIYCARNVLCTEAESSASAAQSMKVL